LLALPETNLDRPSLCFIAPIGARAANEGLRIARELRALGIRVELDARGGSLKSLLRRADSLSARLCLLVGESELERGVVQVKDLLNHTQTELARAAVAEHVKTALAGGEAAS
jgi:histidyl-tRNA synthetase